MPIIVSGIKLPIETNENEAKQIAINKLNLKQEDISSVNIAKKSVDARRGELSFVYSVAIECQNKNEKDIAEKASNNQIAYKEKRELIFKHGDKKMQNQPIIIGFGPAGMFAGLILAREGFKPIIIERGGDVEARVKAVEGFWSGDKLDTECNVQFGEGGAGTFSDGKLTTRIGDFRSEFVLREFVKFGAPDNILFKAKPHIGTDKLRSVVKKLREEIISLGGELHFNTLVENVKIKENKIKAVSTTKGEFKSECVILAIGHSARDSFYMLNNNNVPMTNKPFSVGTRIEHLQSSLDKSLYGKFAGHPKLPVGEYQLSQRFGDVGVYTFCMCPGGVVVPASSEEGRIAVNGMSEYARNTKNANSAFVVSVNQDIFGANWDDGIKFQRSLEEKAFLLGGGNYVAPAETVGSFLGDKTSISLVTPSYARGVKEVSLSELFPKEMTQLMKQTLPVFARKLACFGDKSAVMTGVETRTSSPVKIQRNENFESVGVAGLFPCGEGAGYAGGIMSAAIDGIKVAERIISEYCID